MHCGLRYTKKLTGSDLSSNIKKRVLAQLLFLIKSLIQSLKLFSRPNLKKSFVCFVYNLIEPEIQPSKTLYIWLETGPPVKP